MIGFFTNRICLMSWEVGRSADCPKIFPCSLMCFVFVATQIMYGWFLRNSSCLDKRLGAARSSESSRAISCPSDALIPLFKLVGVPCLIFARQF